VKSDCVCKVGYSNITGCSTCSASDAVFPKTGTCIDFSTSTLNACDYPNLCIEDSDQWGICPYCRAYKHEDSQGGQLSTGTYVKGTSDPMEFTGGSAKNCDGTARTSEAFWYCYYDAFPDAGVVKVTYLDLFWLEDPRCHYIAYIYTPLACDFATN